MLVLRLRNAVLASAHDSGATCANRLSQPYKTLTTSVDDCIDASSVMIFRRRVSATALNTRRKAKSEKSLVRRIGSPICGLDFFGVRLRPQIRDLSEKRQCGERRNRREWDGVAV
jgi:hypothetical protein